MATPPLRGVDELQRRWTAAFQRAASSAKHRDARLANLASAFADQHLAAARPDAPVAPAAFVEAVQRAARAAFGSHADRRVPFVMRAMPLPTQQPPPPIPMPVVAPTPTPPQPAAPQVSGADLRSLFGNILK